MIRAWRTNCWFLTLSAVLVHGIHAQEPAAPAASAESTLRTAEASATNETGERAPSSPEALAALAAVLERAYAGEQPPESVRMLIAIARGTMLGPGQGWFGPAQSRYSWAWLAQTHGISEPQAITAEAFRGPAAIFRRLDRDGSGEIAANDFDWSERSPFVQQSAMVQRLLRRMDSGGDGRVTRDEISAFFDRVAQGKDAFQFGDLREALFGGPTGFSPGDAPSPDLLVRALFRGEIGSLNEGPRVDDPAPDFRLKTHDGKQTIRLSEQLGSKPVVLVFGNFTCGPFRSLYPLVDELCQRYQDQAVFLSIYVREAHPTDGWHMESNVQSGINVMQPKTYLDRVAVAEQCNTRFKHSMPLLVDEINDPVGNAYSGMPGRLYVIDAEGKVAYKNGRGPFGFKSGELEQALLMTLLDAELRTTVAAPASE